MAPRTVPFHVVKAWLRASRLPLVLTVEFTVRAVPETSAGCTVIEDAMIPPGI